MKILMIPDANVESISARWRCVTPANALKALGHHVGYYKPEGWWPDIVVFSRPMWAEAGAMVRGWRQRGVPVVCDLDDYLFHGCVPETSYNTWIAVESRGWPESLHASFSECSAITVSTPEFLPRLGRYESDREYGDHKRPIEVLRNYYDDTDPQWSIAHGLQADRVKLPGHNKKTIDLAFLGSQTHAGDLLWIKPALARILNDYPEARLFVTEGNQEHIADLPQINTLPYVDWREYALLLGAFDVILAPLEPHPLNACKSWIRLLEANLAGVPYVCSATGPYLNYRLEGIHPTGFMAEDRPLSRGYLTVPDEGSAVGEVENEWYHSIACAIAQPKERLSRKVNGRTAAERLAMSKHVHEYEKFYTAVIEREKTL